MARFKFNFITREQIRESPGGFEMINAIDHSEDTFCVITGCPGSGKTTISIHRAAMLQRKGKSFMVVTFTTLLQENLKRIAEEAKIPADRVRSIKEWFANTFDYLLEFDKPVDSSRLKMKFEKYISDSEKYEELIIDEGQDLWPEIYESLYLITNELTVGADDAQSIYNQGTKVNEIKRSLSESGTVPAHLNLTVNFRNPRRIYDFARSFVPMDETSRVERFTRGEGDNPIIYMHNSFDDEMIKQIERIIRNNEGVNIGILCETTLQVDVIFRPLYERIEGISRHHSRFKNLDVRRTLVTTLHSAKGMEFEVVILPYIEKYSVNSKEKRRLYYTGCTRAKQKLFLLCQGGGLPEIFNNFEEHAHYEKIAF